MKFKDSRISAQKSKKLCEFFVAGIPARTTAELVGANMNTTNLFFKKLRAIILHFITKQSPFLDGEVEIDNRTSAEPAKAREAMAPLARCLCSGC